MVDDRHLNGVANKPPTIDVVVVMVPFVAQGHLNQLLHLSRLVSAYNIPVHFVSTTVHVRQARHRLNPSGQPHSLPANPIHFHSFPTPPFTSPLPNPSVPFPSHLQPACNSSLHLRHPVADLVQSLSQTARRVVVVHDRFMSYVVQDVKSIPNAETYHFHPLSAFYAFWSAWERKGRPFPVDPKLLNRLPSDDGTITPEFLEFVHLQIPHMNFHVGELYDSSRVIEREYLERLASKEMNGEVKQWAFGPFNRVIMKSDKTESKNRHKCLQWLDKKPQKSVIYVSFGTTTTFTKEQIWELATGLEKSMQRFVWVLRHADKGDVFGDELRRIELPNGFEERVEGRGLVMREWVPQTEILGHPATGGFMSHCGWNSSMESITLGVPMATWPMHSDQPKNALLITDVLRIGLTVKDYGRRDELVTSETVEMAVRTLLDSKEGEEMRRRAVELSGAVKDSVAEGGVSRKDMDSFISYITR